MMGKDCPFCKAGVPRQVLVPVWDHFTKTSVFMSMSQAEYDKLVSPNKSPSKQDIKIHKEWLCADCGHTQETWHRCEKCLSLRMAQTKFVAQLVGGDDWWEKCFEEKA